METGPNPPSHEQDRQLIAALYAVIEGVFERFGGDIQHSPRTAQELVELQADGLLSIVVTRQLSGEPDAVSMLSPGEQAYIKYEDVFFVHKDQVHLQRSRVNDSARGMIGFGTSSCIEVRPIEQHEMSAVEEVIASASLSTNPQVEL
jgi:hypothetical protein